MTAKYSVIQYVPDLVRNERVNIGVVAFSEEDIEFQFLQNWRRVKQFGGNESALRSLAKDLSASISAHDIGHTATSWCNSIQFTKPAPSTLSVSQLLVDAAERYLVDPQVTERRYRTRGEVKTEAVGQLKKAISERINRTAFKAVKSSVAIEGSFGSYDFDIRARNGGPIFGANVISFQTPQKDVIKKSVDAAAWAIEDVRKTMPHLPLAVIAAPPRRDLTGQVYADDQKLYEESQRIYTSLNADLITESNLPTWSKQMADELAEHFPSRQKRT